MALIVLAVLSAVAVSVGVGMVFVPAGVICGGLLGLAGCYLTAYVKAKGVARETP